MLFPSDYDAITVLQSKMLPKIADTNCIEITIYLKPESQNLQYNALAVLLTNTFENTGFTKSGTSLLLYKYSHKKLVICISHEKSYKFELTISWHILLHLGPGSTLKASQHDPLV